MKIWSNVMWRNDDDCIEQWITSLEHDDDNSIIGYFHLIGCVSDVLNNNDYVDHVSTSVNLEGTWHFFCSSSSLTEKKSIDDSCLLAKISNDRYYRILLDH